VIRYLRVLGAAAACCLATTYCGEPTALHLPTAGWLEVRLSARDPVGIVRLSLRGGPIDSIVGVPGTAVLAGQASGAIAPLIVVGDLRNGTVACVGVQDVFVGYTATVEEAASSIDYSLVSPADLVVSVVRASPTGCP